MKKFLFIVILILSVTFYASWSAAAQEIEIVGGAAYTTFDHDWEEWGDLESAFGFYVGGQMQIADNLSATAQYSRFSTDDRHDWLGMDLTFSGIEGILSYNLNPNEDLNVKLMGGIGSYTADFDFKDQGATFLSRDESDVGFKVGAGVEQRITQNLLAVGNVFYRSLDIEFEEIIGFSGIEVNGGVAFQF